MGTRGWKYRTARGTGARENTRGKSRLCNTDKDRRVPGEERAIPTVNAKERSLFRSQETRTIGQDADH